MTIRIVGPQCARSECIRPTYRDGLCRAHWDQQRAIRGRAHHEPEPRKSRNPLPLRTRTNSAPDQRLLRGAFITDGTDLYEVLERIETSAFESGVLRRLMVEDCHTLRVMAVELSVVQSEYRLVREASEAVDEARAA
jgi:hypothetical protein